MNNFKINEHVLEAYVQKEDTLQAIALRFNCTVCHRYLFKFYNSIVNASFNTLFFIYFFSQVAELKRLNKIEKEYEIHARKTIKVPITPHTLLLEHIPIPAVHNQLLSSPNNSITPSSSDHRLDVTAIENSNDTDSSKLLSSNSVGQTNFIIGEQTINDIILNTEISRNNYVDNDEFNVKGIHIHLLYNH